MNIYITRDDDILTATLEGRLDTPASTAAAKELEPLMEEADKTLILECKGLTYISSSGLRIFLTLRKAAAAKGGKVIIRHISDEIRQIFMMTGFLNLFVIE